MAIFGDAAVVDAALWLLQREQRGTPLTSSSSELTKASSGLTSSANRIHIGSKRAERDATRHGSSAELTPSPHWQQRHVLLAQIQRPLSQRLLDLEQTWQQDRCAAALYLASGLTEFDSIAAASEALDLATDPLALSFVKFSGAVTSRETRILTLRVLASSEDDANLSSRSDDDVDYREALTGSSDTSCGLLAHGVSRWSCNSPWPTRRTTLCDRSCKWRSLSRRVPRRSTSPPSRTPRIVPPTPHLFPLSICFY